MMLYIQYLAMPWIVLISSSAVVCLAVWLYRKRARRRAALKWVTDQGNLNGKIVVITGANTGLGREVSFELARRSARVILACRDPVRAEAASQWITDRCKSEHNVEPSLQTFTLDLASLRSVEAFCADIASSVSHVDILINNAGVVSSGAELSSSGFELQYAVNHLGHYHLTNKLLPLIRIASEPRILVVTSGYYVKGKPTWPSLDGSLIEYDPWSAYSRSKLANCLHAIELARRLKTFNINVYAIRPGFVPSTDLGRHHSLFLRFLAFPLMWYIGRTVSEGVQSYLHCCLQPITELKSGALYNNCEVEGWREDLVNQAAAEEFWLVSEAHVEGARKRENIIH